MVLICLRVTWLKGNKVNLYIAVICINKHMNYSITIQGAGGRTFAYGATGRRIDPSWGGPIELFFVPARAPRLV